MKVKQINYMLLLSFIFHVVILLGVSFYAMEHTIPLALNMILGQLTIMIPAVIWFVCYLFKRKSEINPEPISERFAFRKVSGMILVATVGFTFLMMPLTTVVNAFSMFFVENTIQNMSEAFLNFPFPVMLFFIAVIPAFVEELVMRGVVYCGYRKTGRIWPAVLLSGLAFGLMHMNINQAMYAFVLGVAMALLLELTGSIYCSILFHFVTNAWSALMMYVMSKMMPDLFLEQMEAVATKEQLSQVLSVYILIAAVTTPIAICLLYWMAKKSGRLKSLQFLQREIQPDEEKGSGEKLLTFSYILFVILTVAVMILQEILFI